MCSDGRANRSPNDAEVGNLICLEASSVMAWHGLQESAGNEAFSHSTWWVMVSDCWRGIMSERPAWGAVCILSWARRDSLGQTQALFFYGGKKSWGRVNVWTWKCVKLYCPDVFIHLTTAEKGPFYSVRNLTWCLHTCVQQQQQLLMCSMFPSAHFSARLFIFSVTAL